MKKRLREATTGNGSIDGAGVCGCKDTDVHRGGSACTKAPNLPRLQYAKESGLDVGSSESDLVEEQGAAVDFVKVAFASVGRSSEGALFVAEDFRGGQFAWKGSDVDGEEGFGRSSSGLDDGVGRKLFAGAGFATDEDWGVEVGDGKDGVADSVDSIAVADESEVWLGRRRRTCEMEAQGDPAAESDEGVAGDISLGESGRGLHQFAVDGDVQILAESGDLDASIEEGKFEAGLSA